MKAIELLKKWRDLQPDCAVHVFDEALTELEEIKNSSCSSCKHESLQGWMRSCKVQAWGCLSAGTHDWVLDDGFCCNRYERR